MRPLSWNKCLAKSHLSTIGQKSLANVNESWSISACPKLQMNSQPQSYWVSLKFGRNLSKVSTQMINICTWIKFPAFLHFSSGTLWQWKYSKRESGTSHMLTNDARDTLSLLFHNCHRKKSSENFTHGTGQKGSSSITHCMNCKNSMAFALSSTINIALSKKKKDYVWKI